MSFFQSYADQEVPSLHTQDLNLSFFWKQLSPSGVTMVTPSSHVQLLIPLSPEQGSTFLFLVLLSKLPFGDDSTRANPINKIIIAAFMLSKFDCQLHKKVKIRYNKTLQKSTHYKVEISNYSLANVEISIYL